MHIDNTLVEVHLQRTMPKKYSVFGCFYYTGYKKVHVFGLPNNEDLKKRWIIFINRENITE